MRKVTTLITDLDNTLFDWVNIWFQSFNAMLNEVIEISGISKETLLPEISRVHQKHGTSEYSFLLEEVPSLVEFAGKRPASEVFETAIDAYRGQRRSNMHLYPTVAETLLKLKGSGVRIVAYTESMAFYSGYRIRRLGLDGVIDHIYCPSDHVLPNGINKDDIRKYPSEHYEFRYSNLRFTEEGHTKPSAKVLGDIFCELDLDTEETIYVGDSLMKDIAMANDFGIDGIWAKYGRAQHREEYELLRAVTHWTDEDVERERQINEREHVNPTITLENTFSEIMENYSFEPHTTRNKS